MRVRLESVHRSYRVRRPVETGGRLARLVRRVSSEVEALHGIDLQVDEGETVGYIGLNGAGKSTTMKLIAGILTPTAGRVTVDGRNPHRDRRRLSAELGYLAAQRASLWWDLPVQDSYELMRRVYDIETAVFRRRRDHLVSRLDIGRYLNTPVRELSLGNRTRAELVGTLLHAPRLLLLDEPTIGLDIFAREAICDVLRDAPQEITPTIVMASHDLRDVEAICDRIVLIDNGRLVHDGKIDELRALGAGRRKLVVQHSPGHRLPALAGLTQVADQARTVTTYEFTQGEVPGEFLGTLFSDPQVDDVQIEAPSLEDLIKDLYVKELALRRT
ncbi:ATP-binding cassette domain-containing protein [Streptomyces sp. ISL-43]|uniref:ATP-binding cassette domain-containing protein n=1 Tax=Streptomyces sp. ISL-43 TaxID=2819183 RepID=UPI001BEB5A71|nr:ATP-binding cassette domain-containing protein [Streptomyces sp. ISL-43]MBT2453099.1 ATP-binding cassette domain-containing protein [Streptomyces sp. ISL-43]